MSILELQTLFIIGFEFLFNCYDFNIGLNFINVCLSNFNRFSNVSISFRFLVKFKFNGL